MTWFSQDNIFHVVQVLALFAGFIKYSTLDKASKFFIFYLLLSYLAERLSSYAALEYKNNLPVLNLFSIIEYAFTCIFFSLTIQKLKKINTLKLLIVGAIFWIITSLLYSFKVTLNTPFLVFESISIVCLCHYYYYDLLNADDTTAIPVSFWLVSLLLIFWSFTFAYWLFGLTIRTNMQSAGEWLGKLIWIINIICYTGFSLIFLFYKQLQRL